MILSPLIYAPQNAAYWNVGLTATYGVLAKCAKRHSLPHTLAADHAFSNTAHVQFGPRRYCPRLPYAAAIPFINDISIYYMRFQRCCQGAVICKPVFFLFPLAYGTYCRSRSSYRSVRRCSSRGSCCRTSAIRSRSSSTSCQPGPSFICAITSPQGPAAMVWPHE